MSATNRGAKRQAADNYPTPMESFLPLIPYLPKDVPIWEPASGDGRLVDAMCEAGIRASGADIRVTGYDFLEDCMPGSCCVTNPPYSLAFEFVQRAVKLYTEVFMLLRLNFLASQARAEWFKQHEPRALFVLSKRPCFVNGKSDACDYAWFYWGLTWKGIFHL